MDKYIKVGIGVMILDGNKILLGHNLQHISGCGLSNSKLLSNEKKALLVSLIF